MKISLFNSITDTKNPIEYSLKDALLRIKNGSSKAIVQRYRKTKDDSVKKSLPAYTMSGLFSERNSSGMVDHSGIIVLDFDKITEHKDLIELKDSVCDLPFVYSVFISPSGQGLKVLVRIPKPKDEAEHKRYFAGLVEFFDSEYLDSGGSDWARLCFESYDDDIFIREGETEEWVLSDDEPKESVTIETPMRVVKGEIDVPFTDMEIISNLQKWFDKNYTMSNGTRNVNLFKFACALNEYGIGLESAITYLSRYESEDFPYKEITTTTRSAYRRFSAKHNTKSFGSKTAVLNSEPLPKALDVVIEDGEDEPFIFWEYVKGGNVKLVPHLFKEFLEVNGFGKFFPSESKTFVFIRVVGHLIEPTSEEQIKDFVLVYLNDLAEEYGMGYKPFDLMAGNPRFFTQAYLSMLNSITINVRRDTADTCFLYFRNCVVEVTQNEIKTVPYSESGSVWKDQVMDRDYEESDHHASEFRTFVWLISGQNRDKYASFRSVIGYLMHSHKTSSNNKAIIFNDETISENPNGGSGKGVFWNAIAKMKKVSMIDGKTFNFEKSFPYQTVATDTQLLVFDDVKKSFNFESLFSVITEGITLEYKNMDAIKIPVERSPKILITTNYTIGGVGGSHERRKFEVEMSSFFGVHHTPEQEFGHMLFDDWSDAEWSRFDNYMINCIQVYMANGLVSHAFQNLDTRKFIKETNMEFYEWSKPEENSRFSEGVRIYKTQLLNEFTSEYPDYAFGRLKLSQKRFSSFLKKYSDFYGFSMYEGKDPVGRFIELTKIK